MNNFFWSHTLLKAISGGFGYLYNWFCTQPQYKTTGANFGYLYNWYAASDARSLANVGSHVVSYDEWTNLFTYTGSTDTIRFKNLAKPGSSFWAYAGSLLNIYGFGAVGGGMRVEVFTDIKQQANFIVRDYSTGRAVIGDGLVNEFAAPCTAKYGLSIRLIVDIPIEISGNSAVYVGNDLRRYKCVLINSVWYLAENLAETKYRNGDLIPKVTDNTAWAALTTGAMCAYNNDEANAFETASIAPVGWHVPPQTDVDLLQSYLGGWSVAGGKLKETGLTHWLDPNMGATNEFEFNGLGSGVRDGGNGVFGFQKAVFSIHVSDIQIPGSYYGFILEYNSASFLSYEPNDKYGRSLRLLKNDSTFTPGDTITDIDGNVYPLVKIGTQVWTASNWKCTKYNDGTPIPLVEDNATWAALTTGAQCIYGNDEANL